MRKLYYEFFCIPKHGKVREKVMLTRMAMTVTTVIMCLAAMSFTAYAYFSCNITSGSNIIKAANFEANVSITLTDSNNDPITVTNNGKVQTVNLDAGKYTIELTRGNSTAHKGFCVITVGDKNYYTDQIGVDAEKDLTDAKVKFELWLSSPARIEVLSHWGTSVYYGYQDAGRTEIFIVSGDKLDLTTQTTTGESGLTEDSTDQPEEMTVTSSTDSTTDTLTFSVQTPESTTDPAATQPPRATEAISPGSTEPEETEATEAQSITEIEQ